MSNEFESTFGHLDKEKERKLIIVGAIASIAAIGLMMASRNKAAAAAVDDSTTTNQDGLGGAGGGTGSSGYDPVLAEMNLGMERLQHMASFAFQLDSNSMTNDIIGGTSSGSSGVGISVGGYGLNFGSSKGSKSSYDLRTGQQTNFKIGGDNLDANQFSIMAQLTQLAINMGIIAKRDNYAVGLDKLNRVKQAPKGSSPFHYTDPLPTLPPLLGGGPTPLPGPTGGTTHSPGMTLGPGGVWR